MNGQHLQARRDLPNFPEDLFRFWMDEYITAAGWPPHADDSVLPDNRWRRLLLGRPVAFWQKVKWQRQTIDFNRKLLAFVDGMRVLDLQNQAQGTGPIRDLPCDLRERFAYHFGYYAEHGSFIMPVAFLRSDEQKLEILDGYHRLAAFMAYQMRCQMVPSPTAPLDAWLGLDGERSLGGDSVRDAAASQA